jgi:hypothetical protein
MDISAFEAKFTTIPLVFALGSLSVYDIESTAKHLQAYCNEMRFRFDNLKNPYLFRDTILELIESSNFEYKTLTAV